MTRTSKPHGKKLNHISIVKSAILQLSSNPQEQQRIDILPTIDLESAIKLVPIF